MKTKNPLEVLIAELPAFSEEQAIDIAFNHFGLKAKASNLLSERDQNFLLEVDGDKKYVLKIANSCEEHLVTDFQIQALIHIAKKSDLSINTPKILQSVDGRNSIMLETDTGVHVARVVSYLDGMILGDSVPSTKLCRDMGRYLARLGFLLKDFQHPGSDNSHLWAMKEALKLREILSHIKNETTRNLIETVLEDFEKNALTIFDSIRWQVIHSDMHAYNIIVSERNADKVAGIFDFGDMLLSPLIVDLAVAASYLRGGKSFLRVVDGDPLSLITEFLYGYHQEIPLKRIEISILHDLIKTRLAATISILDWRASFRDKDDAYSKANSGEKLVAELFLKKLSEIPRENATKIYTQVCASAEQRKK